MISRPLQIVLAVTVLLTLYSAWQDSQPDDTPARRQQRAATASEASAQASAVAAQASAASAANSVAVNLFPTQTWQPPPPPPPKPTPMPKPTPTPPPVAPPLPFKIVSTWHEGKIDYVVLEANGQQMVVCQSCNALGRVQKGEVLLGSWRVDQVTRQQIIFTFMPLNQQQVLSLGATP